MANQDQGWRRILMILGISLLLFGGVFTRLVQIQLWKWRDYAAAAAGQRQVQLYYKKVSGAFFDRNLAVLRAPVERAYLLINNRCCDPEIMASLAASFPKDFFDAYRQNYHQEYWIYPVALNDIQMERIRALNIRALQLIPGWHYPENAALAWHVLGLGGARSALSGLERSYQSILNQPHYFQEIFTLVDGLQQSLPGLGVRRRQGVYPAGVVLTLDRSIQQAVEETLDQREFRGAVVVLKAQTGEILAMASRPVVRLDHWQESVMSREAPFLNRAVTAYHPGSIFKLIILSAALEEGLLRGDETFLDPERGLISLQDALAYSYNPVFIETTLRLTPSLLLDYAEKLGLGRPCNIGLMEESGGVLPSGIGLGLSDQTNLALGQQQVMTTPLQIASIVQTIAHNGLRYPPTLLRGFRVGSQIRQWSSVTPQRVLSTATALKIQKMMAAVVEYGTGQAAELPQGAAGKTGTAQVAEAGLVLPGHAWFAGYTPLAEPRYVTVVFCEAGISGGRTAAPIFREIMLKINKTTD